MTADSIPHGEYPMTQTDQNSKSCDTYPSEPSAPFTTTQAHIGVDTVQAVFTKPTRLAHPQCGHSDMVRFARHTLVLWTGHSTCLGTLAHLVPTRRDLLN
jgi:hypothetical protein